MENDPIFFQGQNLAVKGLFPELWPGHDRGAISYNEGCVAKFPCIVLNTYLNKVSVDITNVTTILELQSVKDIAVWIICQEIEDTL